MFPVLRGIWGDKEHVQFSSNIKFIRPILKECVHQQVYCVILLLFYIFHKHLKEENSCYTSVSSHIEDKDLE